MPVAQEDGLLSLGPATTGTRPALPQQAELGVFLMTRFCLAVTAVTVCGGPQVPICLHGDTQWSSWGPVFVGGRGSWLHPDGMSLTPVPWRSLSWQGPWVLLTARHSPGLPSDALLALFFTTGHTALAALSVRKGPGAPSSESGWERGCTLRPGSGSWSWSSSLHWALRSR